MYFSYISCNQKQYFLKTFPGRTEEQCSFKYIIYGRMSKMYVLKPSRWFPQHDRPTYGSSVGPTKSCFSLHDCCLLSTRKSWKWKVWGIHLCSTLGKERADTKERLTVSETSGDWVKQQDGWYNVVVWLVVRHSNISVRVRRRVKLPGLGSQNISSAVRTDEHNVRSAEEGRKQVIYSCLIVFKS